MDLEKLEELRSEDSFENILDVLKSDEEIRDQKDGEYSYEIEVCGECLYVNPTSIRKKTKNICKSISKQFIDLAKMIFFVRGGKLYKQWGYSSLEEYCVEELNIKRRKANYLMNIYGVLVSQLMVREDSLEEIGWTKSKDIVRLAKSGHATLGNVNDWVEESKQYTTDSFTNHVTSILRGEKDDVDKPIEKKFFFKLEKENIDLANRAMSIARDQGKTESDSLAFLYICMDFLSGNMDEQYDEDTMAVMMKRIEDAMGVNISVEASNGRKIYPSYNTEGEDEEVYVDEKTTVLAGNEKKVIEFVSSDE